MELKKTKSLIIPFLICFSLFGCGIKMSIYTQSHSIKFIRDRAFLWQKDSMGTGRHRNDIYVLMSHSYEFRGVKWNKVKSYFGKPNGEGKSFVRDGMADYIQEYVYYCTVDSTHFSLRKLSSQVLIGVNPITEKIVHIKRTYNDVW